ncbi:hypothetical protein [Roseomonas sp. BN140053]|uniref:hypothetical protein n=1 Tax=Roseomonas sp. BN140053 TaxID=3391898 RepID=UPI0039ED3230
MTRPAPAARPGRLGLALLAVLFYGLRFAASWLVLARVGADRFDPHGFGLLGDALLLAVLALPLLVLLRWILRRRRPWRGLLAPASAPGWTALSVLLLLLLGAPLPGQVWALLLLPVAASWPVLLAVLFWFATCAALRALAVAPPGPDR